MPSTLLLAGWSVVVAHAQPVLVDASERLGDLRIVAVPDGGSGYSGVAIVDVDADGDLDLYFANGPGHPNALLLNDGDAHFTDAGPAGGADVATGSRGVLAADLDGDGCPDLIANGDQTAPTVVLRNRCDGTFEDHTLVSGLRGAQRNNSVHAGDVDGDGFVDVFFTGGVIPSQNFPNTLYLNQGDGTFVDASSGSGVDTQQGGCAATFTHLDDDDALDLLVANCATLGADTPFEVFVNQGDGTFVDHQPGSRVWAIGRWMGLAVLDVDADGQLDFFATNSGLDRDQPHALYRNNGDGTWTDQAPAAGLAEREFGWGAVASDFDNDGWVDLYYAGRSQNGDRCASPGLLFFNRGDGTFAEPEVPLDLSDQWTTGVATGDLDGNGFDDVVVVTTAMPGGGTEGQPVLLLNQGTANHWLQVRLAGTAGDPMATGARIYARTADGPLNVRELHAGSSYLSSNAPWQTLGLGAATEVPVCVRWPGGEHEDFGVQAADGHVELVQGAGTAVASCLEAVSPATGGGDTGRPDTGGAPTSSPPADDAPGEGASGGCGCDPAPGSRGSPVVWAPWVGLRRLREGR